MCSWKPGIPPEPADEKALDFLATFGFGFVRNPLDFGIVEHGRPGAYYEQVAGYNVNRALLDLILENRVLSQNNVNACDVSPAP